MSTIKTYEAFYEPTKNKGVYGISLVENPAMEGLFIALKKDEVFQFKQSNTDQRILTGLALEPNKPIYRNQGGEEFNIVFSEATIKDLAFGFLRNGHQGNSSLEHDSVIKGVTFTESWLVEDEKNDKSNALGFSYPKGSWMVSMKVDDEAIWNDYVKTGKVKGFSIDAMLSLKEVNLKSEIKMSTETENKLIKFFEDLPEKIFQFFEDKKEVAVKLGEVKTNDGNVTVMFDGETLAEGGKVWIVAEDGTEVPLPVGDYELEDGRILTVAEEGTASAITSVEAQPAMEEKKPAEMTATETDATARAVENAIKSIMIKYNEQNEKKFEDLEAKFTKQLSDVTTIYEAKIVELSSQPARKPVKATFEQAPSNMKERLANTINSIKN